MYRKLTSALGAAGYKVNAPQLLSVSEERPPKADLTADTTLIRDRAKQLICSGEKLVILMHSYGGQVGTNALHGLSLDACKKAGYSGGIVHLIYMTAFAQPEGASMVTKVKEFGHEELLPLAFDFADDQSVISRDPKTLIIGPGAEEKEVEEYVNSMIRWNGKCMYQEIEYCAWREIPVSYIYTTQDMTVPLDYQKSMVEGMRKAGREVQTYELEAGHCPNLTMTREIVDIVNKIASNDDIT